MEHIKQFHKQHGYYVRVAPIAGLNGCTVRFPNNTVLKTPTFDKTYILYDHPYSIELFVIIDKKKVVNKTIDVTSSNIRLLVLQDIFLQTHKLNMSKDLIVVEESNSNLFDMLEVSQTKEEKKVEAQLCVKFRELLAGNVVTSDIEGYEQVLSCFESGGL